MAATARKEASVVERATLSLLGVPADAASVAVATVRQGFAELDFAVGPRLVALDFLPPCGAGDVLSLSARGLSVEIAVDIEATREARARLLSLWSQIDPASCKP